MFIIGYIIGGGARVLSISINFICLMLLIRIILELVTSGYLNLFLRSLYSLTEPFVSPFRKVMPRTGSRLDLASIVALIVLFFLNRFISRELLFLGYRLDGVPYRLSGLPLLLHTLINIYYWIILIRVLISWVSPDPFNPIVRLLNDLTEPFLRYIRSYIPLWRIGVDISPFVAILILIYVDYTVLGILNRLLSFLSI